MSPFHPATTRGRRLGAAASWLAVALATTCLAAKANAGELWTGESEGAEAWVAVANLEGVSLDEDAVARPGADAASVATPLAASSWIVDPQVVPAQAAPRATPPRRSTTPTAVRRAGTPALASTAAVGLASVPFMIGDTGAGTCIGFQGILESDLSHPTLACARLNVAEANTALPVDRLYYSYRHFHNASQISAYQFEKMLDYDRHVVAWERTFWGGGASIEMRLPIEQHITSKISTRINTTLGIVDLLDPSQPEQTTELGNIAAIFKYLLWEDDWMIVSGGLGITLPTARDVDYHTDIQAAVIFPDDPGLTADVLAVNDARFANETVYLEPFLAWLIHPGGAWYHQGFLQVEVAANPTHTTFFGNGVAIYSQNGVPTGIVAYEAFFPSRTELISQSLMRLNLGLGRLLVDQPTAPGLKQLAAVFEMHYTTTLNDAKLAPVTLTDLATGGTPAFQEITIGNEENRVDILNAAAGVAAQWGPWSVTNGFVAPIREERGYDFEYNLQLQRLF